MKLFSHISATTKALLVILLVVILAGAGFGLWAWKTGKLSSSADTIFGNLIGQAYIQLGDNRIQVTGINVTITPGSGPNSSTTTVTCDRPLRCPGNPLGSFKFTLLNVGGFNTHVISADEFDYNGKTYIAQPLSSFTISAYQTTKVNLVFIEKTNNIIQGRVTLPDGSPASGYAIWLFDLTDDKISDLNTTTDWNGHYEFKNAIIGHNYSVPPGVNAHIYQINNICYDRKDSSGTPDIPTFKPLTSGVHTVDFRLDEGIYVKGKTNVPAVIEAELPNGERFSVGHDGGNNTDINGNFVACFSPSWIGDASYVNLHFYAFGYYEDQKQVTKDKKYWDLSVNLISDPLAQ